MEIVLRKEPRCYLIIHKEHYNKLIELNALENWKNNMIWACDENQKEEVGRRKHLYSTFEEFISCSFFWANTPEGHKYWGEIAIK